MSLVAGIIASVAMEIAAPLIVDIIGDKFGDKTGALAGRVITAVAKEADVHVVALPEFAEQNPKDFANAIQRVERMAPEMIALWSQGLSGQFALAMAEFKDGKFTKNWRPGWMYMLMFFWTWVIVFVPTINAVTGAKIETIAAGLLLTLTGWFISLYMGGHTLKELGKNAIDAVKTWKATK